MAAKSKNQRKAPVAPVVLNQAVNIPLNKLTLSKDNVRTLYSDAEINALADSIAERSRLQSLSVRPALDADGAPIDAFEVPGGARRRLRALLTLVKRKRLAPDALVPCVEGMQVLAGFVLGEVVVHGEAIGFDPNRTRASRHKCINLSQSTRRRTP